MKTKKVDEKSAIVICGSCGKEQAVPSTDIFEPVDHFGGFIDIYYSKQEFDRLEKRAKRLEEKQKYSELAFVYSLLADICEINATEAFKDHEETKSEQAFESSQKWKKQGEDYRKESKDFFSRLKLKELEDGIDDSIYEDAEDSQFQDGKSTGNRAKRGRSLEDILDDKGFLEF